jgi:hypothetical protein
MQITTCSKEKSRSSPVTRSRGLPFTSRGVHLKSANVRVQLRAWYLTLQPATTATTTAEADGTWEHCRCPSQKQPCCLTALPFTWSRGYPLKPWPPLATAARVVSALIVLSRSVDSVDLTHLERAAKHNQFFSMKTATERREGGCGLSATGQIICAQASLCPATIR